MTLMILNEVADHPHDQAAPDYEHPDARKARMLAEVMAHPSYEAVKATKAPGYEPSLAELDEHAKAKAFDSLSKAQKIARFLDDALSEARLQVQHGGPITRSIVDKLEAIRALVS